MHTRHRTVARLASVGLLCLACVQADTPGTKTVVISLTTGEHGEIIPVVFQDGRSSYALPPPAATLESSYDPLGQLLSESHLSTSPDASTSALDESANGASASTSSQSDEANGSSSAKGSDSAGESAGAESLSKEDSSASAADDLSSAADESVAPADSSASAADTESAPSGDSVHDSDSDSDAEDDSAGSSGADVGRKSSGAHRAPPMPIALCIGAVIANIARF